VQISSAQYVTQLN